MKRLLPSLIAFLFLFLICGCKEQKVYRIGISQCSSDDWRDKMNDEVMREAMIHEDVEVEIRSAHDNSQKQIEDLKYFADNDFDVIVVAPNEAKSLTPEVKSLYEKGIPVVIFDRSINDTTYTQQIGVDNVGLGISAGEYAMQLLSGKVKALELYGLRGATPADQRSAGFEHALRDSNAVILARAAADWQEGKARLITDSLLEIYPETNLIFAHNDRMALGAYSAAVAKGRPDIKIIGIDAAPNIGMQAVSDGKITATFLYPTEGELILREAIKIAKGEPVEKEILLPTSSAVDASNADILLLQSHNIDENTVKVLALKDQLDDYVSLHQAQTALVYAIIAILVLLFGVLFLVLRTFWSHRRHQYALLAQNKLLEEERDKQKELNLRLEEATQSKLIFFTNVSHDLRTPLTLIAEPVSQVKDSENLDEQQHTLLKIADKNIKILQRLIDQILDFRKFESNKLTLSLSEVDFSLVIRDWMESFHSLARKRDINLSLKSPDYPVVLAMDVEKIERVFFNILSNAFKYSPDNSDITVDYYVEGQSLVIKVEDRGEGISREDLIHIFDRFFQVDRVRPKGSGIGLALAKAFVELHGGSIEVESQLKKGTVFTIKLPVVHVAVEPEAVTKTISSEDVESEHETFESTKTFEGDKPIMLVIDDNKDIRELVTQLMKDNYNVITAPNGTEGIKKATKYVPDIVVCDVMMPGMDGMECCSRIKNDTITSHIPVLMLTACSLDEQRVQGLESGADAYLSKPFSSEVLKAQASSLIANRKRVKDMYAASVPVQKANKTNEKTPEAPPSGNSDIDSDFYNRFLEIFDRNMGDPDLNVEALAAELGFERTQLYRKIKALTNYSPVELMRNLRLKKARTLLKTSDKSVSEVCYLVGFSTPAYFTKCYREQFGETPSSSRPK